ncbi:MAG: (Fe-S)-binding protein [Spirochaetaceae bacterium]
MILQAALLMGVLGLLFAVFLGFANRTFHLETNPKIDEVEQVLPGVNCGGCGYPSCAAYAEAVAGLAAAAFGIKRLDRKMARSVHYEVESGR